MKSTYKTSSHNQNEQVQYVYHCCLCLILVSVSCCKQTKTTENDNIFHLATCNERKDGKGFKLTVFHLRAQTRCKSEHARGFTARQQNCVGLRAVAGRGPRAAGPWQAVGRGPLGRGPAFSKTPP